MKQRSGPHSRLQSRRSGLATVEFAIVLPLLVTLVMGSIELANMIYLKQSLQVVALEGAKVASSSKGTKAAARRRCRSLLRGRGVSDGTIRIQPAVSATTPRGTEITVTIEAPMDSNGIGLSKFGKGKIVRTKAVMVKL